MVIKNLQFLILISLMGLCAIAFPMDKTEKELENSKIALLNHYFKMVGGESPINKTNKLPRQMIVSSPKTFCMKLTDLCEQTLFEELAQKGISKKDVEEEWPNQDTIIEEQFKKQSVTFKPASSPIKKMVLKQAKERGIARDLAVVQLENQNSIASANNYLVMINEKEFDTYSKASQRTIIGHELTHTKQRHVSKINAIEKLLKEKKQNPTLTPDSEKLYTLFRRNVEIEADLTAAAQNQTSINGYKELTESIVRRYGPGMPDTHPANSHRNEASILIDKVIKNHTLFQKKSAKKRLFEDEPEDQNQPAVTKSQKKQSLTKEKPLAQVNPNKS